MMPGIVASGAAAGASAPTDWVDVTNWPVIGSGTGWEGYTLRTMLAAAEMVAGTKVRLTFTAHASGDTTIDEAYVQLGSRPGGDNSDFSAPPILLDFSGSAAVTIPAGTSVVAEVDLVQDGSKNLNVSAQFPASPPTTLATGTPPNFLSYYKLAQDAATEDGTGYLALGGNNGALVTRIEVLAEVAPPSGGIGATAYTSTGGSYTTHTVTMPAGLAVGDRCLVMCVLGYGSAPVVTPQTAGWTEVASEIDLVGTYYYGVVFEKIIDGTEGATQDFDVSVSKVVKFAAIGISGAHASQAAEASHAMINPAPDASFPCPPLTPSWGPAPTAWVAFVFWYTGNPALTFALPDNQSNDVTSFPCGISAEVDSSATKTPGDYSWGSAQYGGVFTVGVKLA